MLELEALEPTLVWGLFVRGLGLIYVISFASLFGQVLPFAGRQGAAPVSLALDRIRRDFPSPQRFAYFPTLLWFRSSDAMLRGLALCGALFGAVVVVGGPWSPLALLACYLCHLSLDLAMALIFPWDCLLFECTLLGLWLPATRVLPELSAIEAPAPALAWAYRILLFRLMFGFGKQKFLGSRRQDTAYLRGFLVNQPLPSKLAWYFQKLPLPVLRASLWFMFLVEIPVPFLAFFPGVPSLVCAGLTAALMLGIQAMGTFGYFSLLTTALCLTLLDSRTPLEMLELGARDLPATLYVGVHTLCALCTLPFNSWLGQSWHFWAYWYQLPRAVQPVFSFLRALHPFRWLHPYGVFPPNNTPAVKMVPVFEASWDDQTWHELTFRYSASHPASPPRFIAPHHPRGDQALIYDTFGLNATSLMNGVIGVWSPYPYACGAPLSNFCQSLLRGDSQTFLGGSALERHAEPPTQVRVSTHMLEPVTVAEHRRTGNYWSRRYVGPHRPPERLDPEFWHSASAEPELWHFEAIVWRRRSRLSTLMKRATEGRGDPDELVLQDAPGLSAPDVEQFWGQLVPLIGGPQRHDFDTLPDQRRTFEANFDKHQRRRLERLLGRFALCLVARFEPLYLYQGRRPQLPAPTYFHLWMLAHHIIGSGAEAYRAAFAEPLLGGEHLARLTPQTGLYALGLFRFDAFRFEAQKLRLIQAFTHPHDPQAKLRLASCLRSQDFADLPATERFSLRVAFAVSGYFHVLSALRDGFQGPRFEPLHPECYPEFVELASGEVQVRPAPPGGSAPRQCAGSSPRAEGVGAEAGP